MKTILMAICIAAVTPIAAATEISVTFSDEFSRTLNEDYGAREGEILSAEIVDDIQRAMLRSGGDSARIEITILDAKPNRPTREQISAQPGLDSFRSVSIGGMDLQGTAFGEDGLPISSLEYSWFESDIRNAVGKSTWSDANRASSRFANKLARQVANVER